MDLVLKQCPFCGECPESGVHLDESNFIYSHIRCKKCDYSFEQRTYIEPITIDEFFKRVDSEIGGLVTRWNTRTDCGISSEKVE